MNLCGLKRETGRLILARLEHAKSLSSVWRLSIERWNRLQCAPCIMAMTDNTNCFVAQHTIKHFKSSSSQLLPLYVIVAVYFSRLLLRCRCKNALDFCYLYLQKDTRDKTPRGVKTQNKSKQFSATLTIYTSA